VPARTSASRVSARRRSLTLFGLGPKWPRTRQKPAPIGLIVPAAGAVAQMGERRNRTAEVRGSNPLGSTNHFNDLRSRSIWWRIAPEAYRKQPDRSRLGELRWTGRLHFTGSVAPPQAEAFSHSKRSRIETRK
jgi:hypothetical protein